MGTLEAWMQFRRSLALGVHDQLEERPVAPDRELAGHRSLARVGVPVDLHAPRVQRVDERLQTVKPLDAEEYRLVARVLVGTNPNVDRADGGGSLFGDGLRPHL